jgi:hypothetical protein
MKRAIWTLGLAGLALLAACGRPAMDPGPDPAKVVVAVRRAISAESLQTALDRQGPFPGRAVRLVNFLGPFWDIKAEVKQPDGSWRRLPLAPGQKSMLDGYTLDTRRVFLAPPGVHQLRLGLEANINRSWEEQVGDSYIYRRGKDGQLIQEYNPRWRTRMETIYLLELRSTATVELKHGQEVVLNPFGD